MARLNRARESINEMIEQIHGLMTKTASSISEDTIYDVSIEESNDEWDEF